MAARASASLSQGRGTIGSSNRSLIGVPGLLACSTDKATYSSLCHAARTDACIEGRQPHAAWKLWRTGGRTAGATRRKCPAAVPSGMVGDSTCKSVDSEDSCRLSTRNRLQPSMIDHGGRGRQPWGLCPPGCSPKIVKNDESSGWLQGEGSKWGGKSQPTLSEQPLVPTATLRGIGSSSALLAVPSFPYHACHGYLASLERWFASGVARSPRLSLRAANPLAWPSRPAKAPRELCMSSAVSRPAIAQSARQCMSGFLRSD